MRSISLRYVATLALTFYVAATTTACGDADSPANYPTPPPAINADGTEADAPAQDVQIGVETPIRAR
jgi:hypothetical protein